MRIKYLLFLLLIFFGNQVISAQDDKDVRRQIFIKNFINDYRTAYQEEKIDYIRMFFSSDALIITETGNLSKIGKETVPFSSKERPYEQLVESRNEYISRLSDIFDNNDGINIGISETLIRRHPKYPEIYGVYFFQIWDDTGNIKHLENRMPGYIFLMIDFRDSEITPIMHVRTWQPKQNITQPSDKYSLEDFTIISYR